MNDNYKGTWPADMSNTTKIREEFLVIFTHRISHGRNETQQTDMYTGKNMRKNTQKSGQVSTY